MVGQSGDIKEKGLSGEEVLENIYRMSGHTVRERTPEMK